MVLPDHELRKAINEGRLSFTPALLDEQIGPASIDLRLSRHFRLLRPGKIVALDPREGIPSDYYESRDLDPDQYFVLHAHEFVLASTLEYVRFPADLAGRVEGKSTLARMSIIAHSAGFVDPGFEGTLTLEISNQQDVPVKLYPGMYICQLAVFQMKSAAEVPYGKRKRARYQGDQGPTQPRTENLFPQRVD